MDTPSPNETREAEIEESARALGVRAAHLRVALHSVLARHHVRSRWGREERWSAPTSADGARERAHEQSQIDHEARHCARRMEHDALVTPHPL